MYKSVDLNMLIEINLTYLLSTKMCIVEAHTKTQRAENPEKIKVREFHNF